MKIRNGFVTNSSSTNFLIISKNKLTEDYLYRKLGFKPDSPLYEQGMELCSNLLSGASNGVRWFDIKIFDYENIKKVFGEKAACRFSEMEKQGCHVYAGYTRDSDGALTCFFTLDAFEISEPDFYLNACNCSY